MSQIFPQNLVTFGADIFSLGKNISTFEEYIPLYKTTFIKKMSVAEEIYGYFPN